MKKKIFTTILLIVILFARQSTAQILISNTSTANQYQFKVSQNMFADIIQHNATPGTESPSSVQQGSKIMWLEYGDGGFITNPVTNRYLGSASGNSLLIINRLYDTVIDNKRISSKAYSYSLTGNLRAGLADNDITLLNNSTKPSDIFITPNVYDIVKKDTMCFALTYKIDSSYLSRDDNSFYVIFFYKNNAFTNFNKDNIVTPANAAVSINSARLYHADNILTGTLLNNSPFGSSSINTTLPNTMGSYNNYVVIKVGDRSKLEKNNFLSLFVKENLAAGGSTKVKAVLVMQSSDNGGNPIYPKLAEYETPSMDFRLSHDPNYITQFPVCMNLPKTLRIFNYRIHFQNTGEGNADKVKITAFLPTGMVLIDRSSVRVVSKVFALDQNMRFSLTVNQAANTIEFNLKKRTGSDLLGITGLNNAFVNPVTMGDIYFNLQATTAVPDTMQARASIEFHSTQAKPAIWESPVVTNIARSYYSTCTDTTLCNCNTAVDSTTVKPDPGGANTTCTCKKFIELCWWWWVIIGMGLIIIYLLIRKRKEQKK